MTTATKILLASVAAIACLAVVRSSEAQTPMPPSRAMSGHSAADSAQSLVNFITTVNRDEIALGKLAMSKASNADVKEYARRMVEDHTNTMDAWSQKVASVSLTIPDSSKAKTKSPQSMAGSSAMSNGISEVRDTTTVIRGGVGAAAIHSANVRGLEELNKVNGAAFDALYIQMQLDGHDAVLKELTLRPVTYTELQTLLTTFRTTVENHQVAARKLKTSE